MDASAELRQTPLREQHLEAGGKLVPFAGWEMPVTYAGVKPEHLAVRSRVGVFDVSHMGEIEAEGPGALDFLQRLLSNDVATLEPGGAQYACMCAADGGILDDLFTYRLADDRYLTVTNAANHEADLARFREVAAGFDVQITDRAADYAMLAVQGPEAREIVADLLGAELPPRMHVAEAELGGSPGLVCGTGYTGEPGVELLTAPDAAAGLWDGLIEAGVEPVGLGARDTLRLEVCFHLHGNDIGPDRNPIEAGLGWICKEQTGFIGSEPISTVRENGPRQRLVAFAIEGRGIPRAGNALIAEGAEVGTVTSGTFSPSLELGIGMGYVATHVAEPGTALEVDVRGRRRDAVVRKMPLYAKSN